MSLTPQTGAPDPAPSFVGATATSAHRVSHSRWLDALLPLFAFGVGLFLVIVPWIDSWTFNSVQGLNQFLRDYWEDPGFRAGISGLGFANLFIGLLQTRRAVQKSK